MAHSKNRATDGKITYPPGVKEISDKISKEEMVRRLKDIFMFITRQLKGLEDTKSAQFNRYFYLLENIAWVKSYNICFELEDSNEIFTQLYRTLFQVIK
ncbi:sister chromatid cohesion PDS5 -like protein [Labeo rohita]|uniref:Sister chromatid cohesion PDS5-like protein n=1 Tax=Labeo rohita TaxID=84645 RepID=A0A498MC89_LABRO|nr:sister chromatid cohesion PDS5 -like protein [Labeo rohita]